MRLNFLGYAWYPWDGYGRYCAHMVKALRRAGVTVTPHLIGAANAPQWLLDEWGLDWSIPTISCLPPFYLRVMPKARGAHWLLTMTEGSRCPEGWDEAINRAGVDRVVVPCEWNADAFRASAITCPVNVVPGGTDPAEFPYAPRTPGTPYTFLALGDRGNRKGYDEVYQAFYKAFGGKTTGDMDVRLIIKSRPDGNKLVSEVIVPKCTDLDKRITFDLGDYADMRALYAQVDCVVIPSRAEGWGMPQREAAMMGLPVITQAYAGLDDGHTREWAIVVEGGRIEQIPRVRMQPRPGDTLAAMGHHELGEWRVCDVDELAAKMRAIYADPDAGTRQGIQGAAWLRANQTWDDAATQLVALLQREGVFAPEMELA